MKTKNWQKISLAALVTLGSAAGLMLNMDTHADARGGGGGMGRGGGGGFAGGGGFGGGGMGRGGGGDFGGGGYGGGFGRGDGGYDRGDGGLGRGGGWHGDDPYGGGVRDGSTGAGGNWGTGGGSKPAGAGDMGTGVQNYGGGASAKGDNGFGLDHANGFNNQWSHVNNQWSHVNNQWSHVNNAWSDDHNAWSNVNNAWSNVHNEWNSGINRPFNNYTPLQMANRANLVRDNFNHYDNFYGDRWWNRYPGSWWCPGWGWGDAWGIASWGAFGGDIGMDTGSNPDYYDYGGNITYNNNNVYYNTTPVATTTEYYTQAETLANSGNSSNVSASAGWKPLGVYSLVQGSQTDANAMFQLAMDKNGNVGGNYYSVLSGQMLPVKGKLDKKNQRVAWTVGTNKNIVYDTGLGNLFQNQAPILVHFNKAKTEQWLMVRMQRPPEQSKPAATPSNSTSAGG